MPHYRDECRGNKQSEHGIVNRGEGRKTFQASIRQGENNVGQEMRALCLAELLQPSFRNDFIHDRRDTSYGKNKKEILNAKPHSLYKIEQRRGSPVFAKEYLAKSKRERDRSRPKHFFLEIFSEGKYN